MAQWVPFCAPVDDPVMIIGTGRSGTTFPGAVLGARAQALFLNEPKAMCHFVHGAEDVIGFCTTAPARFRLGPKDVDARMAEHRF